jgi:hypothetical protein
MPPEVPALREAFFSFCLTSATPAPPLSRLRHTFPLFRPEEGETGIFVTATDILAEIGMYLKNTLSTQKVGLVMKKLGFEKEMRGSGNNKQRGYVVVEYTLEQVNANRQIMPKPDAIEQTLPF